MRTRDRGNSSSARRRSAAQAAAVGMRSVVRPAITLALLLPAAVAWADGQIRFKVINAKTKAPLPGAIIKIDPSPSEIDELQFSTASDGLVTTGDLSSGQRTFEITAIVGGVEYKKFKGRVSVVDDQVVDVEVPLDERGFEDRIVRGKILRLNIDDTSQSTFRDRKFFELFPLGVGNRQSLNKQLRSIPGMVYDSVNRVHARGEEGGLALYVDGFQVPNFLTGSTSQFLVPDAIETLTARTGGYSAEQSGGAGAVLDVRLRPTMSPDSAKPWGPQTAYRVGMGEFGTNEGYLTVSRQRGAVPDRAGDIGFFAALSRRTTGNFLEAPQPDRQSGVNNGGKSDSIFTKMEIRLNAKTEISSFFSIGSSKTGVANRTGLAAGFRPNQGFGFGGADVSENYLQNQQGGGQLLMEQQNAGNRVSQSDNSRMFVTQLRQEVSPSITGMVSMGYTQSRQFISNNSRFTPLANLPANGAIEYRPTVLQDFQSSQTQIDVTIQPPASKHKIKAGLISQSIDGGESMQFVPQSQQALQKMLNFSTFIGNRLQIQTLPEKVPVLFAARKSDYTSLYVQDSWVPKEDIRVNGGLRLENYKQIQSFSLGMPVRAPFAGASRTSSGVSLRLNTVYQFPRSLSLSMGKIGKRKGPGFKIGASQPTLLRASFNQVFTPALGQGSIGFGQNDTTLTFAAPNRAQMTDQVDISIERQLNRQSIKLGTYTKKSRNAIGYQQMILGPQTLAYSTVDLGNTKASGFELTYEYNPRNFGQLPGNLDEYKGLAGFLSLARGSSKRQVGGGYIDNEFDQKSTITAGVGYTMPEGDQMSLSYYSGSGLASSVFNGGGRQAISELNLRLASAPGRIGNGLGVELGIENLLNGRNVMNFNGSYAGTRFQQGRRWVLSVTGKY